MSPSAMLDLWRDLRLSKLGDRAFCRRVSLAGWELAAAAAEDDRALLIQVNPAGLPRTAARALRLFALARPLDGPRLYATGAPDAEPENLEAAAQAKAGGGALVTLRRLPADPV